MQQPWRFVNTGNGEAAFNMALDEALLLMHEAGATLPTLRVYGWRQPFEELEALQPEADPPQTSLALKALKEREHMLLVGHEPHLSAWLGLLIGGPHGARCQMKKASVACVEVDHAPPVAGSGQLKWLMTSKQLAMIGKE